MFKNYYTLNNLNISHQTLNFKNNIIIFVSQNANKFIKFLINWLVITKNIFLQTNLNYKICVNQV